MSEEDLFDAYLLRVLDGEPVPPGEFLAEHGGERAVSAPTLERLEAIHAEARARAAAPVGRPGGTVLAPGQRLGDYELIEHLGGGGMGLVFRARQRALDREVALKVIRPERLSSASALERFRREARGLARLRHPHVVALFDSGVVDGVPYMAMELVPGEGLDTRIASARATGRPLPVADVLDWGAQLAGALQAAHDAGLVHRDVKPSNVIIDRDGRARLLDFGVVRDLDGDPPTLTGPFAGSPPYAAPEQIAGEAGAVDARTDVYALGVLLHEALTGRVPFAGDGAERVFHRILSEEPAPPHRLRPGLPPDISVVVLKALEKDPGRRYADARALGEDLRAVRELRPIAARPPGTLARLRKWGRRQPAAAGGAVAGLLAALLLIFALVAQDRAARERRARQVADAVAEARETIERHETLAADVVRWGGPVHERIWELHTRYFDADERRQAETGTERLRAAREELGRVEQEALDAIALAERLGPADDEALTATLRRLRGDLVASHLVLARHERGTEQEQQVLAERLARLDLEGRHRELLDPRQRVLLEPDPADADVFAFRYVEQAELVDGGERRLVPVPVGPVAPPVAPGTWVLAVRRGAGPVRAGDLVTAVAGAPVQHLLVAAADSGAVRRDDVLVSVDGRSVADRSGLEAALAGAPGAVLRVRRAGEVLDIPAPDGAPPFVGAAARAEAGDVPLAVLRDGEALDLVAPPGLSVRTTAAPLLVHPDNRLRPGPDGRVDLPRTELLFLVRHAGRDPLRIHRSASPRKRLAVTLPPAGVTPPGWVPVVVPDPMDGPPPEPFWIMEREVTAGEYLAFLHDPATQAALDAAEAEGRMVLRPRSASTRDAGGLWPRGADGRFSLPDAWQEDWPVHGISWDDAMAYVAWRNEQARRTGRRSEYALPTAREWRLAAGASATREFPFGNVFRSWWTKSCFSRPTAAPESVLRFPVDESVFGAFDMAGSVAEWCADWYDERTRRRHYAGGAWAYSDDGESFRCWSSNGGVQDVGYATVGFRLVMRRPAGVDGATEPAR